MKAEEESERGWPKFGTVFLILWALLCFIEAGKLSAKPIFMTDELGFSENTAVLVIHLESMFANLVMLLGNVFADMYCGSYLTVVLQLACYALIADPLCIVSTFGYFEADARRLLFLAGEAAFAASSFGKGSLNGFLSSQFAWRQYEVFLVTQFYIKCVANFLGALCVPQIILYTSCFESEYCYSLVWISDLLLSVVSVIILLCFAKFVERKRLKRSIFVMSIKMARDFRRKDQNADRSSVIGKSNLYKPDLSKDAAKVWSLWSFYVPFSLFWGLFGQRVSTLVFQASGLEGALFDEIRMLPNQVWSVIPLFSIVFHLLFRKWLQSVRFPLRTSLVSLLVMITAFTIASQIEVLILANHKIHMVWTIPHHLLISFSHVFYKLSFRKYSLVNVPKTMQGVNRNFIIISKVLGNAIVSTVILIDYYTDWIKRYLQYVIYCCLFNTAIIVFTLFNPQFDVLLNDT